MTDRASGSFAGRHGPLGPLGGFLERFRRGAGVPPIVGRETDSVLAAVFSALDQVEREVEELRFRSSAATARREYQLEEDAEQIVADARGRAGSERDEIVRERLQDAHGQAAGIVAQAEVEATRIRQIGEQRLPQFVAEVLSRVREAGS